MQGLRLDRAARHRSGTSNSQAQVPQDNPNQELPLDSSSGASQGCGVRWRKKAKVASTIEEERGSARGGKMLLQTSISQVFRGPSTLSQHFRRLPWLMACKSFVLLVHDQQNNPHGGCCMLVEVDILHIALCGQVPKSAVAPQPLSVIRSTACSRIFRPTAGSQK